MQTTFFKLSLVFVLTIFSAPSFSQSSAEDRAHTFMVRGLAAVEMARNDDELTAAIVEFKKATEIDPTLTVAWYNLGKIQAKTGQFQDAIHSLKRYLALVPQAEDAPKVRDEIIKLEYRLESLDKVQNLSGVWLASDGLQARIDVTGSKLLIRMQQITFPQSTEVWMYGDRLENKISTFDFRNSPVIHLEARGDRLAGSIELAATDALTSENWCTLPAETNQVSGRVEQDKMFLEVKKLKFKVVMNGDDNLFSSPKVHCDGVSPAGEMVTEIILTRTAQK